ncbi:hypothetical protein BMS3Bbin05_00379 [bacterium BMS3Bbin05]|nr:hypothetical protein BMS3Bbin05_00379 [bacterium BMS3Bbin05]
MIKKVIKKGSWNDKFPKEADLAYWLTKSPRERIETVEILRRQYYGGTARLQRIVKVVQRTQR